MSSWMKAIAQWGANRLGCELIPKWRLANYGLNQHLRRVLALHRIDCIVDVGANLGQYHDFLRQEVGFTGRIVSFEPLPALAAQLKARAASDPGWTVHACGLGSANDELELNAAALTEFSSFLTPDNSRIPGFAEMNRTVQKVRVPVRRLDEVLQGPGGLDERRRVYLKIDTQGFDLEVLKGAEGVLPDVYGIQSEVSVIPIYEGMPTYLEMLQALKERGYSVSGMFPVTLDKALRAIEFDCVTVRDPAAIPAPPAPPPR